LVNFPVLVKLSSSNIDYTKTQDSGRDIRFTDTDGSDLAYEIEKWDETGTSWVWVKVPQIDINSSTDYIYLYYGNTSATDHQQATSVWSANYAGVWHIKETGNGTAGEYADSTNTNNGQGGGGTSSAVPTLSSSGQLDGAQTFDGGDYIATANTTNAISNTSTYTIELWFKTSAASASDGRIYAEGSTTTDTPIAFLAYGFLSTEVRLFARDNSNAAVSLGSTTTGLNNNAWHYAVGTRNGSTFTVYVDGSSSGSTTSTIGTTTINKISLGAHQRAAIAAYFNGIADEIRVSSTARSAAWIAATYKSETDAFNTFASEEQIYSSTPGTLTSSIFDTEFTAGAAWGTLTYNATTPSNTSISVKARTSNSSSMTEATAFSSCNVITSASDISSNNCVTDSHRYIQY